MCVDFASLYDLSIRFWNCLTSMVSFVFHFMTRLNYDFREYKFIAFVVNKLSKLACKIETQNDLKKKKIITVPE